MKKPYIFAVSGYKNAGKTTLLTGILPYLTQKGYRIATIKHDGHEFNPDVPGTDSYRHVQAGAYGTAVFSDTQYMIVKQHKQVSERDLIGQFPESDMILLEGFKFSDYPKLEVVRSENNIGSVCRGYHLEAIATDKVPDQTMEGTMIFALDAYREIADFIEERYKEWRNKQK